ncbi:hypothetical protein PHSY_001083 [Pseudozyma hubeiensis SY62]|uniref:Uncharacterized protein n=1 Tax=Pseudozyma hubeiensis (strain SY62) TaxID=1305764 RepID=R9NXQ4_PSEHS|nr:hypothetical protein PHSY_001083 [Pseudozyma hubeiensis SY62]GAC93518.1 hypothetical protein PHSY_001083 [Pseudozyma hubeiensis SY62]
MDLVRLNGAFERVRLSARRGCRRSRSTCHSKELASSGARAHKRKEHPNAASFRLKRPLLIRLVSVDPAPMP